MKAKSLLTSCALATVLMGCVSPALAQRYEIRLSVLRNGDGHMSGTIRPSLANYNQIKGAFPNPYPLLRDLTHAEWAIENATISYHDAKHQLQFAMDVRGLAVNQGDHWEIHGLGASLSKVSAHGRELVLAVHDKNDSQDFIATLVFPSGASDITVDPARSIVLYRFHPHPANQPVTAGWGLAFLGLLLLLAGVFMPKLTRLQKRQTAMDDAGAVTSDAHAKETTTHFCTSCGAMLPEGDIRFCPHCGSPVSKTSDPTA